MQLRTLYIAEIDDDNGFQNVSLAVTPHKQYILISGLFYPDDHNGYKLVGSFSAYAKKYINSIVQAQKDENIIIYNIDILEGTISKTEYSDKKPPVSSITKFDKVTDNNYVKINNSIRFDSAGKTIISKTDLYKLIDEIGKNQPNTLQEVNIFSHAYWNGPILVNSDAGSDDHDMRKDDITSSLIDFTTFKNAFSSNGIFKIWGCSFPKTTNALFSKFRNNSSYSPSNTILDTSIFTFPANSLFYYPEGQSPIDLTAQINAILKTTFKVTDKISLTFLQIKKILIANYIETYAGKIASNCSIKVQAALPATYAEITPKFHIASSTLANVTMYKKHLDIQIAELNYGIYDDATIQKLLTIYNS